MGIFMVSHEISWCPTRLLFTLFLYPMGREPRTGTPYRPRVPTKSHAEFLCSLARPRDSLDSHGFPL